MLTIKARKLLAIPAIDLPNYLTGRFNLLFDNGEELTTSARETILSANFWIYHQTYPLIPLLKEHHLTTYLQGKRLSPSTHTKIISHITHCFYEVYPDYTEEEKMDVLHLGYVSTTNYYNNSLILSSRYTNSSDILDLKELVQHPKTIELKKAAPITQLGIKKLQKDLIKLYETDDDFKDNHVAKMLRSSTVKSMQVIQSTGPYGYPKDVDSNVFKYPILDGYFTGMRSLYDVLTESRTAAMALFLAGNELKNVEYSSRKAQLMAMSLLRINKKDCQSRYYIPWEVTSSKELKNLEGMYHLEEGLLKRISPHDEHLVGRILKLRSIFGCQDPDPNAVCAKCFGELSRNVLSNTNIGQQCVVTMMAILVQLILSTKHHISSGVADGVKLDKHLSNFFSVSDDKRGLKMKDTFNNEKMLLTIPKPSILNLSDILNLTSEELETISVSRVTKVSEIKIEYHHSGRVMETQVDVSNRGKMAFCSRDLLRYIREHKVGFDSKGNYVLDLSFWDKRKNLFKYPLKQTSTVDFGKGVKELLEARLTDAKLRDETNPVDFAKMFIEYTEEYMDIHYSVLMTIAYTACIVSLRDNDYALPKPLTRKAVGVLKSILNNRSLGGTLAYQGQNVCLASPETFLLTNRTDHLFDWMILPSEVIKYHKP